VDHESPLLEAIIPYRDNEFYQQMLHALAREFHIDLKKPFKDLPEDVKEGIPINQTNIYSRWFHC